MTIAISAKVNDGIALAADSATTVIAPGTPQAVINVYDNANKIFNLCKGLPVGAITWGAGSIGQSSIATLVKDFRSQLSSIDKESLDPRGYSIEVLGQRFEEYVRPLYETAFEQWPQKPLLGFMLVGYSAGKSYGEEWRFQLPDEASQGFKRIRGEEEVGVTWNGDTEAITRLMLGFGTQLGPVLAEAGLDTSAQERVLSLARERLQVGLITPPMPIQDLLDLTRFLVETAVGYSRFRPGAPTVGGPIELAAITKHEGFKWVARKHYFHADLNPSQEV